MVRTAAPPQLLCYTTQDVLTTAIYPNTRYVHNCHSPYTTQDLHTTILYPTEPGTSTQLLPILHNTGHPHKCHPPYTVWAPPYTIRDAHTTTRLLRVTAHGRVGGSGWGTPCSLGSSLPMLPSPPAKQLNWGGVGTKRERRLCRAQLFKLVLLSQLLAGKGCPSPTSIHVSSGSHAVGAKAGYTGPSHGVLQPQPCAQCCTRARVRGRSKPRQVAQPRR